jgi:class 3 adenylate cyclase
MDDGSGISVSEQRTILFADVSGSTRIIERAGDVEGRGFVAGIVDELSRITDQFRGTVVKTIGDEVMSSFAEPLDAVVAAVEMQRVIRKRDPLRDIQPKIKVGVHGGPVIIEQGDVHGDVVNVAARVVAMAKADQILTTAATMALLAAVRIPTRSLGSHTVRGREEPLEIREILWEENTDQLTTLAGPKRVVVEARLELRLDSRVIQISTAGAPVHSLGRGEDNYVVVPDNSASRVHADIIGRAGRFYLADRSTNGTYLRPLGGVEIFVHRDEVLLGGTGLIRLGRPFSDPDGPTLEYRVT